MNIGIALSWECWRRGYWLYLLTGLGAASLPALVYGSFLVATHGGPEATAELLNADSEEGCLMHCTFFAAAASLMAFVVVHHQGTLTRYLTLPVSIPELVGWKMLQGVLAAILMYLLMGTVLNAVFQVRWPLLGPALFLGTLSVAGFAVRWALAGAPVLQAAMGVALVGALFRWFAVRYGVNVSPSNAPLAAWRAVSSIEVGTLLLANALMYLVTVVIVSARRGEKETLVTNVLEGWQRLTADRAVRQFNQPMSALAWSEWHQRGRPAVILVAVLCTIVLCIAMTPQCNVAHFEALVGGALTFLLLLSGLFGVFLGQRTSNQSFGTFAAAQPVSDGDFGRVILTNVLWCFALSCSTWIGLIAVLSAWFLAVEKASLSQLLPDSRDVRLGVLFAVYAVWCLMSIGAMLGVTRRWCLATCFTVAVGISIILVGQDLLHVIMGNAAHRLAESIGWTVAISVVAATFTLFIIGRRQQLIRGRSCAVGLCIFFVVPTLLIVGMPDEFQGFRDLTVLVPIGCLPALPIAGLPVALAWNRHR